MEKPEHIDHDQISAGGVFVVFIIPIFMLGIPIIGLPLAILWFFAFMILHEHRVKTKKYKQDKAFREYREYLNNKGTTS